MQEVVAKYIKPKKGWVCEVIKQNGRKITRAKRFVKVEHSNHARGVKTSVDFVCQNEATLLPNKNTHPGMDIMLTNYMKCEYRYLKATMQREVAVRVNEKE